jgi:RND family efflux transporter MFP subunit
MRTALVLLVLAAAALSACTQEAPPPPPPIRPVLWVTAAPQTIADRGFSGTVQPRYSTDRAFRVLGRMVAREVDVGDAVEPGQFLAALDPTLQDLAVRSSEADLSKATAQLSNATSTEERQKQLVVRNASTQADLDAAVQVRESAAAAVETARSRLSKAKEQFGYTRLVADTAGIVTATGAEVGQVVAAGQTVVTIAQADIREAVVDVPDDIAKAMKAGDAFDVTLQIDPSARTTGKIREVAPQADASTRTRRIKITLEKPPAAFRLGTTVTAAPVITGKALIALPATAVLDKDGKTSVWVFDKDAGTVATRAVAIATPENQGVVLIASGIEAGTTVVTAGVHSLEEGQKVQLSEGAVP